MSQSETPKYDDVHPAVSAWLNGANPDDLQSVEDWTLEPWPVTQWERPTNQAHPFGCNCPACADDPDDEPGDIDTDDEGDPAEGWMADSWAGVWDDDPSPYDGTYSEE